MSLSAQRAASSMTASYRSRPARGWSLPNFRLQKTGVNLPLPRMQKFESKVLFQLSFFSRRAIDTDVSVTNAGLSSKQRASNNL